MSQVSKESTYSAGFVLLVSLLVSVIYSPTVVSSTDMRLDTIGVFVVFIVLILSAKLRYYNEARTVILAYLIMCISVVFALSLQALRDPSNLSNVFFINAQGYLRPLLYAILAACFTRSLRNYRIIVRILLYGIIYHGMIVLLDYFKVPILSSIISILYFPSDGWDHYRSIGAFGTVHSLAYFGLISFIFCLFVASSGYYDSRISRLGVVGMVFSLPCLILPFSRAAILAALLSVIYITFVRWRGVSRLSGTSLIKFVFGFLVLLLLYISLSEDFKVTFSHYLTSIFVGVQFLLTGEVPLEVPLNFIEGRLGHGWKNSLEVWSDSPLIGNLSASQVIFIGDGGYTESLALHGILGFLGLLFFFFILYSNGGLLLSTSRVSKVVSLYTRTFTIALAVAALATGFLKFRVAEILPVMLVCLYYAPRFSDSMRRGLQN